MATNRVLQFSDAYQQFLDGRINRRSLLARAAALGIPAMLANRVASVAAQESTPAPDHSFTSITTADALAQIRADFPMSDPTSSGGVVIIGGISGLTGTNVVLAADAPTLNIMGLVTENLTSSNPKDGQPAPGLADSWEIAPDGVTYTYHLRSSAVWHDGMPFTADDVIFSIDAASSPDSGSSYSTLFNQTVASSRKIDDQTIEMVASGPMPQIIFTTFAFLSVMPKHIWGDVPFADWASDPGSTGEDPSRVIGTGPFMFDSLDPSTSVVTLKKNPTYDRQVPTIDEFKFQVWPDQTAEVEALRGGEIDIVYGTLAAADANALKEEPGFHVDVYDTYDFVFCGFNLDPAHTTLFEDVRTRKALAYAIDRQSIVDNIVLGYGEVAEGSQPVLSIAYAPDRVSTHYAYDPEKAKQLLADAGWIDDGGALAKDGQKLEFSISYGAGSPVYDQIMAYLQEAWGQIGIKMTPSPVDFATVLLPMVSGPNPNHDFDIFFARLSWDATADQSAMFSSSNYVGGINLMKYANPEVDKINEEASRTLDEPARVELLIQSMNLVNEDLPALILYFFKVAAGYSAKLNNYFPNPGSDGIWSLPYVWIAS